MSFKGFAHFPAGVRLLNMIGFAYFVGGALHNQFIYANGTKPLMAALTEITSQSTYAGYTLIGACIIAVYYLGNALFPIVYSNRIVAVTSFTLLSLVNPIAGYLGIWVAILLYLVAIAMSKTDQPRVVLHNGPQNDSSVMSAFSNSGVGSPRHFIDRDTYSGQPACQMDFDSCSEPLNGMSAGYTDINPATGIACITGGPDMMGNAYGFSPSTGSD